MAKKKALGKGLGALISGVSEEHIHEIDLTLISPNPFQPRVNFKEEEITSLARTIKEKGVLQPVILRKRGRGYELISGERRVRASRKAGLKKIPAIIKDATDREMLEMALLENLQRENLNPVEEARAYDNFMKQFGLKQEEVAERVGKSRSAVANTLRLLKLPEKIQKALLEGVITAGHARALLSIKSEKGMLREFNKILQNRKTVRDVEKVTKKQKDPNIEALEKNLKKITGLKVEVHYGKRGGKITFFYKNLEELETLLSDIGIKINSLY